MSDRWPHMMLRETAAEFCDMTPEQFDRNCPVAPIDQGWRGFRWKRARLEAWIESLPEKPRKRKIDLDRPMPAPANEPAEPGLTVEERRAASLARLQGR